MNLIIDLTGADYPSISQLQSYQQLNEITFLVPVFLFFQNNFNLLLNYILYLNKHPLTKTHIHPIITEDEIKKLQQHNVVLVRGTFDHLHLGHQILLLKAIYSASHKLIIEVKDDSIMNNKKLKQLLQPVELRKQNIKKFIQDLKPQLQVKIETITQVYGSAPYTKAIDAIAITEQSLNSLNHINKLRKSNNGFKKVQMIISPLMAPTNDSAPANKQTRIDSKISSLRTRQYLLRQNNFTLTQYTTYRSIWDSLVKEINSLCRVKDIDFLVSQKWWQRILYKHTIPKSTSLRDKPTRKSNKQILQQINRIHNKSTPNQQSLNTIAINMALMFEDIEEEEKSIQAVVRNLFESLMKKRGKTRSCKKIKKMVINDIKEFIQQTTPIDEQPELPLLALQAIPPQIISPAAALEQEHSNETMIDNSTQTNTTFPPNALNDSKQL